MNEKNKRKKRRLWLIPVVLLGVCIVGFFIYVSVYYHAKEDSKAALNGTASVTVTEIDKSALAFIPDNPIAGMIFYPGGKVEYTAHAPLMLECAERGILCILLKMPFNLAVFDMNGADGFAAKYSDVEDWYVCGHSLGGAMAANYAAAHSKNYKGLILLAAYSTKNLDGTGMKVLSLFGTEDGVMNRTNYEKNKSNLPKDYKEYIIEGGNHANFGDYGDQKGDGKATIPAKEQWLKTADYILEFISAE